MEIVSQLLLAALGSLGFAFMFKVPKNMLIYGTVGGAVCWGGYILGYNYLWLGIFGASLFSTVLATFFAEYIARIKEVPTPMIAITAYIPLIPGKGLYYCMSNAVARNWDYTWTYGIQTLQCALGMALGMSLVFAFFEIRSKLIVKKV